MSGHPKPTICRICKENCEILVRNDGGRMQLTGNPDHPVSKGFICFRGRHFDEVHHSPKRLRTPLLLKGATRVGISWDEALDLLATRFLASREEHGAQSVAFFKGESLKNIRKLPSTCATWPLVLVLPISSPSAASATKPSPWATA